MSSVCGAGRSSVLREKVHQWGLCGFCPQIRGGQEVARSRRAVDEASKGDHTFKRVFFLHGFAIGFLELFYILCSKEADRFF